MLALGRCLLDTGTFILIGFTGNRNTGLLIQVAWLIEVATKIGFTVYSSGLLLKLLLIFY